MKIKQKIITKKKSRNQIILHIKKKSLIKNDIEQLFQFFERNIKINHTNPFYRYFKITSTQPAIMISFVSTINDVIAETYFSNES